MQVLVSVCIIQEVFVCVCVYLCVCVCVWSLVCMVGVIYVYIDTVFGFYVVFFCFVFLLLSWMFQHIVWTPAVLSVLYACVLYFCICTCSAQLSMFHRVRRSRNTLIIIIIVITAIFLTAYLSKPWMSKWHTHTQSQLLQNNAVRNARLEYVWILATILLPI